MHELSVASSLYDWARQQANTYAPRTLRSIEIEMDALSCLNPEALRFGFEALIAGTLLDGLRLDLVVVGPRYTCRCCGSEADHEAAPVSCDACGAPFPRLARDGSPRIVSFEVE